MKIEEGLAILELVPNVPNVPGIMYLTLVWDDKDVVLFDAGLPGQADIVLELIKKEGVNPERLSKVIITHHDMDHIGSLATIVGKIEQSSSESRKVDVLAHQLEIPYIHGDMIPQKFSPEILEQLKKQLAERPKEQQEQFKAMFTSSKPKVTDQLTHQQELSFCGGIVILHTPGHTDGHISIYLKKYKTLVAGDLLHKSGEKLLGPDAAFDFNNAQSIKSVEVVKKYDIEKIISFHGGLISENTKQQLESL